MVNCRVILVFIYPKSSLDVIVRMRIELEWTEKEIAEIIDHSSKHFAVKVHRDMLTEEDSGVREGLFFSVTVLKQVSMTIRRVENHT